METLDHLRVHHWLSRGHSRCYGTLLPNIDRGTLGKIVDRAKKIELERHSIELFRSIAREVASPDEQNALREDIPTLMVLRHYGVPTRLLDWSWSPYIAAFFTTCNDESCDGELWSFEYQRYREKGDKQWEKYLGADRYDVAFNKQEPDPDFFTFEFLYQYFHRVSAQEGLFSLTAKFGQDHALSISKLLEDNSFYKRYIIKAELKPGLRQYLRMYGIWGGTLFPDTVGAAETVKEEIFQCEKPYDC